MKIPSTDVWPRHEFLMSRALQMNHQKILDEQAGLKDTVQYIDMGDEIICDTCDAEIVETEVILVEFGRRVNCRECFNRWYAKRPIQYRRLNPDGTLGEYVQGEDTEPSPA